MSWQLASFGLLAIVLAGGAVWYERSKPSAKLVAMVAALVALAVAGRVALAPIPNVVATTDIVLLGGYALGGAPGFAIGALAALVSNFWLGQGPWTPWQMAGWGMVGVGGAVLARLTGRSLGRFWLAAWCGIAGLAYGALLDLSVMVTYGGEQSLDRYLALSARGVPFNIAHAAGNVVFALIAGPALVRMLLRFRSRMEVTWQEGGPRRAAAGAAATLSASLLAIVLVTGAGGLPSEAKAQGAGGAAAWLEGAQNADGGFGIEIGAESNLEMTTWAALALEAGGRNPLDVSTDGRTPIDYLQAHSSEIRSTNDIQRVILVLEAAGLDAGEFAGRDFVATLRDRRRRDGSFRAWPNLTAFGILALAAAGVPDSDLLRSANWLRRAQARDGGWGAVVGTQTDPDSTGAVLQALAAAGLGGSSVSERGVAYLKRNQLRGGGWALTSGGTPNSQSTAYCVQGLLSFGVDPADIQRGGDDPFDFLSARQASDGHYRYSASSDQTPVWVTAQALLAVSRQPFPLSVVARAPSSSSPRAGAAGSGGAGGTPQGSDGGGSGSGGGSGAGPADGARGGGSGSGGSDEAGGSNDPSAGSGATTISVGEAGGDAGNAPSQASGESDHGSTAPYLAAAFGALALAMLAGFLWYRRRLP